LRRFVEDEDENEDEPNGEAASKKDCYLSFISGI
jgi:hypothetical protein